MNRGEVLATALSYITKDRAATHGDAEDSFAEIAAYWSIYMHRHCPDGIVEAHDVAALMVLFKVARLGGNPLHDDNWVDTAGYAALGAELAHGFHYPTERANES